MMPLTTRHELGKLTDTEQSFGTAPRSPRYRSLDAWRGAACVAIVLYHSSLYFVLQQKPDSHKSIATDILRFFHFFSVGVPVFFVISGYCIAATADMARRRNRSIRDYFIRRFRRIFPPYWIVLMISVLIVALVDVVLAPGLLSEQPQAQFRPWWFSPSQWVGNLTLTETWRHHVFGSHRGHFVGQSWTLCYEEQFYAVIGLFLLCSANRFFMLSALLTAGVLAAQISASAFAIDISGFFFDGAWLMFAAGILVYHHINYAVGWKRLVGYLIIGMGLFISSSSRMPMVNGTFAAFAFALLIMLTHRWDDQITSSNWARPLSFCGTMCYSLYLVHGLLVNVAQKVLYRMGVTSGEGTLFVTIPVCLTVSVVAGWAFYLLVERRFLNSPTSGAIATPNVTEKLATILET